MAAQHARIVAPARLRACSITRALALLRSRSHLSNARDDAFFHDARCSLDY
jgi:hypothetical protein